MSSVHVTARLPITGIFIAVVVSEKNSVMAGSHRAAVEILDMSRHFFAHRQKCRDLICFIKIDTSCIYRGQYRTTPYDSFVNRYVPYGVTFQTVHPKSHVGVKYSHG